MEVNKILQADVLDIIFDGRNKDYGAYDLRRTYNRRLLRALGGSALLLLSLVLGYTLSNLHGNGKLEKPETTTVDLTAVLPPQKNDPLPPPPPRPRAVQPQVATIPFTKPLIVPNTEEIKKEEKPPEQTELDNSRIGTTRMEGVGDIGSPSPPVSGTGTGVVDAPKQTEAEPDIFTKVEIESMYPGDTPAWQRYLNKNFRYPEEAINETIQGTVIVKFIVDKEGNVSDVEAISGPETGGLREEAVRVIKKSGKWKPAIQNGRPVKSYKSQPIIFRLDT
jgi:protein TonB